MKLKIREIAVFGMLGALMYASKMLMEILPNIHLLGVFTMAFTLVYRKKALIPIDVYVLLVGLYGGFGYWWIANTYTWTILWAATMLLPRKMPKALAILVYCTVRGLHGLSYGTLCAPPEAIIHGFNLEQTLAWIASGIPFDVTHAIGNVVSALLVLPLQSLLLKLEKRYNK